MTGQAHVEAALEFTVAAQLHENNLVERETDEVQRLRDRSTCILGVGHLEQGNGWTWGVRGVTQLRKSESGELCGMPDRA